MDRRDFLIISALTPLAATWATEGHAAARGSGAAAGHTFGFSADGSQFLLDKEPFQIRSGELHPCRIPVPYWRHRIRMAKAMGLNTIGVYLMWNYLEERPGVFDLTTDRRDFAAFVRLCQDEGMWVLLRPGPYVCAEWDLGGLPAWLLQDPEAEIRVRAAADPRYMAAVRRYVKKIAPVVRPLLVANGGPVLMVQIENEYGSFGDDATYVDEIRRAWLDAGVPGPFYTQDGLAQVKANRTNVPGGAIGLSDGDAAAIADCRRAFPAVPAFIGESWAGWFTAWGDSGFGGIGKDKSPILRGLMQAKLSFNIYMIHGGTSFGYWAGANSADDGSGYTPDITSYDYSAAITEQGRPTASYTAYRSLIDSYLDEPLPPLPAAVATITPSPVTPRAYASLWDNLPPALPASRTVTAQPMETYGQNSGFVLYRRPLSGYTGATLHVTGVHDYATVFLDGAYQGGFSRVALWPSYAGPLKVTTGSSLPLGDAGTTPTLDILVAGLGRVNFGHYVDRKGITGQVSLSDAGALDGPLTRWQTHSLPVDEKFVASLRPAISDRDRGGLFFRAALTLDRTGDTYLDMSAWTKGVVFVNGHNLGRYWSIGPQQRLYCPAPWLRTGRNEIVVFDLHRTAPEPIGFAAALQSAYVLTNRRSGKVLDVPDESTAQGVQLIQWPRHGKANQQWRRTTLSHGLTTFANSLSGHHIDVHSESTTPGAPVIQWPATRGANQQWRLADTGGGYVKLVNVHSGKVLGVEADSTADGAKIVQQNDTDATSQHWHLDEV
ncbi:beta-galactosidase [Streptomyces spectabilis]|uniref:Beta-galactosidase n=1 Tax=Streptomyces spectabilis TaxID=68270 RepID=A0A7W8EY88_STRST|nr:beta-galactosidase [Streptomyces spectabilis]MBB5107440.1 beta-galactosidase [Streptomyces spectabilis]MCI3900128.1 beta-galactosidase [Streptomyces spectabilis]GGV37634.1 beta-galactosidase [Streptomyces spectabilis]